MAELPSTLLDLLPGGLDAALNRMAKRIANAEAGYPKWPKVSARVERAANREYALQLLEAACREE